MKKRLIFGALLLVLFELANVWFIMPLPYSQRVRSIDVAYALYQWRWAVRAVGIVLFAWGALSTWRAGGLGRRIATVALAAICAGVAYATNFEMAADQMFLAPDHVTMAPASGNHVELNRLVVGVELHGEARAYPVQFIGYHHQVRDSVGGEPVLITFCTVCRTGRAYSPVIDKTVERFRLVGMDHFNAMLEDGTTGSWWRQATGEAITGPRRGKRLREIPSQQVTLALWLELHPQSLIMQADSALRDKYSDSFDYENGQSRKSLTGTDTASWHDKSWVVGITHRGESRAYDWNRLKREHVVHDVLGGEPILVVLARDNASFFAYVRPDFMQHYTLRGDSLVSDSAAFGLSGRGASSALPTIQASQEFWHSWREFNPTTTRY